MVAATATSRGWCEMAKRVNSGDAVRIGKCTDAVAAALGGQQEYQFKMISEDNSNNLANINIVSDRRETVSVENIDDPTPVVPLQYPVDSPAELDNSRHINVQLAAESRNQFRTDQTEAAFDTDVLTAVEFLYDALEMATLNINEKFWRAIHLYYVWGFSSVQELLNHLDTTPGSASAIGFNNDNSPERSWYYRHDIVDDWDHRPDPSDDWGVKSTIQEVAKRAVHGVWRAGRYVPAEVRGHWSINESSIRETYPSEHTKREALRNWIRLLIGDATEVLDFDRGNNTSYDISNIIAQLAHSAGLGVGITRTEQTAEWIADSQNVMSGSRLSGLINQFQDENDTDSDPFPIPEISEQFADLHKRVLDRCADYGLLTDSVDVAFDSTDIPYWGYHDLDATIGVRNTHKDSFPKWRLCFLSVVDSDVRLCLDVGYISQKDKYPQAIDRQLHFATRSVDISRFYMDSEGYNGDVIDSVRKYTEEFLIKGERRGKDRNSINYWLRQTPAGEFQFKRNIKATSATPRTNAIFAPNDSYPESTTADSVVTSTDSSTQTKLGSVADDGSSIKSVDTNGKIYTHTPYLTGISVDKRNLSRETLINDYSDRWAAEVTANQLQNHFHPVTQTRKPVQRSYLSNISMLFLNWHTLVNNARSPKLGLSLDVTYRELLLAIQDVGFSGLEGLSASNS